MNLQLHQCTITDFQAVVELNETVYASLPDKSVLRHNSPEMIASCLQEPNMTLGFWDDEKLVAIGVLYVPQCLEEDHAHDVVGLLDNEITGLRDSEALELDELEKLGIKAANQKLFLVRDGYRGLGLQQKLIQEVEKLAVQRGFNLLCTTCAPNNNFSINNFLKEGYRYAKTEEKYGGLTRNLYYKQL
ncbi:MAG: GNAT family N-acetyltransferase [bacterium]|nr:GNAT family N-acetyltransferase [Candidatus Limimorpha equi]